MSAPDWASRCAAKVNDECGDSLWDYEITAIAVALREARNSALEEAAECAVYKRKVIEACEHVPDDRIAKASKAMCDEIEIHIRALKHADSKE